MKIKSSTFAYYEIINLQVDTTLKGTERGINKSVIDCAEIIGIYKCVE